MEGFRGFSIKNIVADLESRETRCPKQDIRETVFKALDRRAMANTEEGTVE